MRVRDSKLRGDELAAVVWWLRRRVEGLAAAADAVEHLEGCGPLRERLKAEAQGLHDAAEALERGEHRRGG